MGPGTTGPLQQLAAVWASKAAAPDAWRHGYGNLA
jgi:hypothetical protein